MPEEMSCPRPYSPIDRIMHGKVIIFGYIEGNNDKLRKLLKSVNKCSFKMSEFNNFYGYEAFRDFAKDANCEEGLTKLLEKSQGKFRFVVRKSRSGKRFLRIDSPNHTWYSYKFSLTQTA